MKDFTRFLYTKHKNCAIISLVQERRERCLMKSIVTISREFGSGGREIGRILAKELDVPFYDKELLEIASKESGICEELFVKHDESYTNSFLFSLVMGSYPVSADGRINPDLPLNHKIFLAQFDTIRRLGDQGPCVIVGRCADYVLRDHPNVVNFFLTGDMADKKARILGRYDIEKDKAEDFIKKTDKRRASYYNYYTDQKWGSAPNFDLCLNTSKTGIEGAVKLMMDYIAIKEERSSD